jgi:hypothetical protein
VLRRQVQVLERQIKRVHWSPGNRMVLANGARVTLTPLMAPRANAHAELWAGSARRECLDLMLIVSPCHFEAVLGEYCAHYNDERPHSTCGLRAPASRGAPI